MVFAIIRNNWDTISRRNDFGVVQVASVGDWIGYHLKFWLTSGVGIVGLGLLAISALMAIIVLTSIPPSASTSSEMHRVEAPTSRDSTVPDQELPSQANVPAPFNATATSEPALAPPAESPPAVVPSTSIGWPAKCEIQLGFGEGDGYVGPCQFSPTEARNGSFMVGRADGRPIMADASAIRLDITTPGKATVTVTNTAGTGVWQAGGEWLRDGACWRNQLGADAEDQDFSICVR